MSSEKQKKKAQLKNISIRLEADLIEKLNLMGAGKLSQFFRERAHEWIDKATLKKGSRENQLVVLNRKADFAENQVKRLRGERDYLEHKKAVEEMRTHRKKTFLEIFGYAGVNIDSKLYERALWGDIHAFCDLISKITPEQWVKIANTEVHYGAYPKRLRYNDILLAKNLQRFLIHVDAQEKLIEEAEAHAQEAREAVSHYHWKSRKT